MSLPELFIRNHVGYGYPPEDLLFSMENKHLAGAVDFSPDSVDFGPKIDNILNLRI
jgi:hypothetical protein